MFVFLGYRYQFGSRKGRYFKFVLTVGRVGRLCYRCHRLRHTEGRRLTALDEVTQDLVLFRLRPADFAADPLDGVRWLGDINSGEFLKFGDLGFHVVDVEERRHRVTGL